MTRSFAARAIVFDLDGVLADSTYAVNASWEAWAKRHDVDPAAAIANGHGRPSIDGIRLTAPHLDAQTSFAEMEELEESFLESVVPIAGAREFVERVSALNVPWAVATSGTRRIAVPRLQYAGIPEPPVLITADDITNGKPDPEPYERAARGLGIEPWHCVVFEDAPSGILSARRAGAAVIGIGSEPLSRADETVRDFFDASIEKMHEGAFSITTRASYMLCPCCGLHTLRRLYESCALCRWDADAGYDLSEAKHNVDAYGVVFRPTDVRFAPSRHPILGPKGEYAIDRVALRERAYAEFRAFGNNKPAAAHLTERLAALLTCLAAADGLYAPLLSDTK